MITQSSSSIDPNSPAALGYRMAAEWEPHAATWISWPHKRASWPGKFEPIPPLYARLVRTLAEFEPVHILAGGKDPETGAPLMAEVRALLSDLDLREGGTACTLTPALSQRGERYPVTQHDITTNDTWTRDHGPTFLVGPPGSPPALVDWGYNAWGGKYPPYDLDDAVPGCVAACTGRRVFTPGIILEGGAIDSNGAGNNPDHRAVLVESESESEPVLQRHATVFDELLGSEENFVAG